MQFLGQFDDIRNCLKTWNSKFLRKISTNKQQISRNESNRELIMYVYRRNRTCALSSKCKTDQAHFTDWISFLQSNLMEEIGPNPELLTTIT